jgi:hypothetical protein
MKGFPTPSKVLAIVVPLLLLVGLGFYGLALRRMLSSPVMVAAIRSAKLDPGIRSAVGPEPTVGLRGGVTRQRGRSAALYTVRFTLHGNGRSCAVRTRAFEPKDGVSFKVGKIVARCSAAVSKETNQ